MVRSFSISPRVSSQSSFSYDWGGRSPVSLQGEAPARSTTGNETQRLLVPVLRMVCSVFGGSEAWIVRKHEGRCEVLISANGGVPGDWELGQVACSHHFSADDKHFLISYKGESALLCADTLPVAEQNGSFFTLAILFEGPFRLSERDSGILEAFRSSLHFMLSHQLSAKGNIDRIPSEYVEATCACCRRLKPQGGGGWLHWDDYRLLTTGKATSHAICESCAVDIYGEEVMRDTASLSPTKQRG